MKDRKLIVQIARERVALLLSLASESYHKDRKLSKRYTTIALAINSHYRLRERAIRSKVCRGCRLPILPGINSKVTVASARHVVIYKCVDCGNENLVRY